MAGEQRGPADLERLLARNLLTRRQFVNALLAAGVSVSTIGSIVGSDPLAVEAQVPVPQYFVLIVLDAFRPDYQGLAPMPALRSLIATGTSYDRAWVAQLESETPAGHATISTGASPRRSGILGFEWRDPKTKQEVLDGWPKGVLAGHLERDLRQSSVSSIPQAVKAAVPSAKVVALSSEKVYAADAMGGSAADYILYHRRTPHQLVPAAVQGHVPPPDFFHHPHLEVGYPVSRFTNWDYLSATLALAAVEEFRPKVLMVNLPGADVYGHPYGGPATPEVMAQVVTGIDRDIARIIQAYQKAGIYNQTLFVVTADHGMVPNDRAVDGNTTKAAVRQAGGQYYFHTGGTAADIYLHNPWHARAVSAAMARVPNVAGAYYQVYANGQYEYAPAPGLAIDSALDNAYRYLLASFAGPTAPDVVAPFRENTIGGTYKNAHGDHGGLNWGAQHVPLVLSGPGVRQGLVSYFPARLLDVAPTVLRLLGVPFQNMDGVVLADALLNPSASETADQTALAQVLTSHQDALIGQSADNIAEDQRLGLHPPASLPPQPSR